MEIKIEKKVPIPASGKSGVPWSMLLSKMEIGDSFLVPSSKLAGNMQSGASSIAKRRGIKISTRKTESGLRVWRIA